MAQRFPAAGRSGPRYITIHEDEEGKYDTVQDMLYHLRHNIRV